MACCDAVSSFSSSSRVGGLRLVVVSYDLVSGCLVG